MALARPWRKPDESCAENALKRFVSTQRMDLVRFPV
jgi:hypothetical protein